MKPDTTPAPWGRVSVLLTLAAAVRLLAPTVADPDLWGHIRFGQRTLAHGLERTDPFSYLTAGQRWINHELLSEVAFGAVYDSLGGTGLIVLKAGIALLIVTLLLRHLVRRGLDPLRACLITLPSIFLLGPGLSTIRPQMFSFLFFALVLLALHRGETRSRRWLWSLPIVLAVWINVHGGVLAGVGAIGVWGMAKLGGAVIHRRAGPIGPALRDLAVLGVACAAALLLNPYGWELPAFLVRTATVPRPDIVEWQPLRIVSAPGTIYLGMIAFGCATLYRAGRPRQPALVAVLGVITLLPLTAVRHLQLFAIAAPVLLADDLARVWGRRTEVPDLPRRGRLAATAAAGVAALALATAGLAESRCIRIDPSRSIAFPVRAVQWLADSGVRANAVTYFSWGEYVIWHLAPDIRVSMDGRRETVYPDSIYHEYLRFQNGHEGWRAVLERPETDLVLFSRAWPAFQLARLDPEWTLVYEDSLAGVFARAEGALAARLAGVPVPDASVDGAGRCVP